MSGSRGTPWESVGPIQPRLTVSSVQTPAAFQGQEDESLDSLSFHSCPSLSAWTWSSDPGTSELEPLSQLREAATIQYPVSRSHWPAHLVPC